MGPPLGQGKNVFIPLKKNLVQNTNEVDRSLGPNILERLKTFYQLILFVLCTSFLCFQVHWKSMNDEIPLKTKPFQSFESVAHGRLARAVCRVLHLSLACKVC